MSMAATAALRFEPDPALSPGQRFALAVGALDSRRTGLSHHWLHGLPPGAGGRPWTRTVLWDLDVAGPAELTRRLVEIEREAREKQPLAHVISRTVWLAQLGASAGYLPDGEAWTWVVRAARLAHATFGSWGHFARSLIDERARSAQWRDLAGDNAALAEQLLDPQRAHSPWVQHPWPEVLRLHPPQLPDVLPPRAPTYTPLQRFALALGAPLVPAFGGELDWLELGAPGDGVPAVAQGRLAADWFVTTRDDVAQVLENLATRGLRGTYREISTWLLEAAARERRPAHAVAEDLPPERQWMGRLVARHLAAHPTIPAFDLARVIHVARMAAACGLLEPHEAWRWLEDTARVAARAFDDWDGYARNYAVGWALKVHEDLALGGLDRSGQWLTTSPASPWKRVAWGDGA